MLVGRWIQYDVAVDAWASIIMLYTQHTRQGWTSPEVLGEESFAVDLLTMRKSLDYYFFLWFGIRLSSCGALKVERVAVDYFTVRATIFHAVHAVLF